MNAMGKRAGRVAGAAVLALCLASCSAGGGVFRLASATYLVRTDAPWTPTGDAAPLFATVQSLARQKGKTLVPDDALSNVARAVASRVAADAQHRTPSMRVVQALTWAGGLIDPLPAMQVIVKAGGAVGDEDIARAVEVLVRDGAPNTLGIARQRASGNTDVVVVMATERRVLLSDPVDRAIARGATLRVMGRIAEGFRNPEVNTTFPDGRSERLPMGQGPEFSTALPLTTPGTVQVEIFAAGATGSNVVASFPVYVDAQPPSAPEDLPEAVSTDVATAEKELLELVNAARRAQSLAPLDLLPAVATVARGHSDDMAANRFFGHVSPTHGAQNDRLLAAGIRWGLVLENIGRGYSVRDLHDGLMATPADRRKVLDPQVTHVGIGVAREPGPGGALVVTENFLTVASTIAPDEAARTLLTEINRLRATRSSPPLSLSSQLSDVAQAAAPKYFQGTPTQQQVFDQASRQIGNIGFVFRRVSSVGATVTKVLEASSLEPLLDPDVTGIGIGVAQGTRRDTPPNALFVIYLLGFRR